MWRCSRVALLLVTCLLAAAGCRLEARPIATNGSFEQTPFEDRPPYWDIGFSASPQSYALRGSWQLDAELSSEGAQSLRLEPSSNLGYRLVQTLHAPTGDFAGKTVRMRIDVRHEGLIEPPTVQLFAVHRGKPPDPVLGLGVSGKTMLVADGPEGMFQTYYGAFTASDDASELMVVLSARGTQGAAWFDDFVVETDAPQAPPIPPDAPTQLSFKRSFATENPQDNSEKAMEESIEHFATTSEVANLFAHIRWTSLTGEDVAHAHRGVIRAAELARAQGLEVMLTFDFTHDLPETVGDLNTLPDGSPPGSLYDEAVFFALLEELFALHYLILPEYVMVGVEMDIFYHKHPDDWPGFVSLFKTAAQVLVERDPDLHVSSYFELQWMVNPEFGYIEAPRDEVWQLLLPELQSVAFSIYPGLFEQILGVPTFELLPGFFTKASEIAPGLPIIIPEFGVPGGRGLTFDETDQAELLSQIIDELSTVEVEVVTWYSGYNQTFVDEVPWFTNAFQTVGLLYQNGDAKPALSVWRGEEMP